MVTPGESVPALVPVRMLNEHVYCPRLAFLEWTDQRFVDNGDTARGSFAHRRVDRAEVWFAATRTRHTVSMAPELAVQTMTALGELRETAGRDERPAPLAGGSC